jgi:RNA polymerase sigma factor (sigma-70 family)
MDGREGRRARFESLFDAHAGSVRRYLLRRGAGDDTDDLVADVFLTAWRRLDDVPAGFEAPWLYRTAWNLLANHRRRPVASAAAVDPAADDFADGVIDDLTLLAAWRELGTRDREILLLVAWEGLDGQGLAEALDIGVGGAGAALSRARANLAAAWARAGT